MNRFDQHREFPAACLYAVGLSAYVSRTLLLSLSTVADAKISKRPWVNFQSAGWVSFQSAPTFFLVLLPVISFVINLVSWMRFGVDVPLLDDMRQYASNGAGRMDWDYIMYPGNDTLYPIGLIFDALAFRLLDGNTVAYQTISMVLVLGGILLLQWCLLGVCTNRKIVKAVAFLFTIFMLQPDSYWGWQNMAFHQAIPVLCSLLIVFLVVSKQDYRISALLIFLIAGVSGFTYTSGAFANLSLLIGLCVFCLFLKKNNSFRIRLGAVAMILPTLITVAAQLWVLIWVQHGTHRPDAPMAYPWESDFWYYLLGKIGRALMLPAQLPELSMSVSVFVLAVSSIIGVLAIVQARQTKAYSKTWNASIAYVCLFSVVLLYLFVVSAGRANLRPEFLTEPTDIFVFGYARFHFFWVCLLWPWVVAFVMEKWIGSDRSEIGRPELPLFVFLFLFFLVLNSKIMSHSEFYRETKDVRIGILSCLSNGVSRGISFECPALHPGLDMLKVYYKSSDMGASYTQMVQKRTIPLWSNDPPPQFRLTEDLDRVLFHNMARVDEGVKGVSLNTLVDPMLEIDAGDDIALNRCSVLRVSGSYHIEKQDFAQLFYLPTGIKSFSEQYSTGYQLAAGDGEFSFEIKSDVGFEGLLRFDPVVGSASITLKQLEVRCVLSSTADVKNI
ncbi:uncharacterized protein YegP (UPF0339 family) [Pseudomonas corrugata]|uniref:hypothetical protein n=2 Tax=Pseudomonas TaxID=286 RepID=UPI002857C422|nr:hypothetical protein [Pseudomonas corrugata]MDR7281990.1 uncharacterized protein YegP (UPF0339 family) [Pseudomonas corrugata]